MKRKIEIQSVGTSGVNLAVTFSGVPCIVWPRIQTSFGTLLPGSPEAKGRDYYVKIVSPGFRSTVEAVEWLEKLTREVREVATKEQQNVEDFKKLEGETEI